jgi:hypothetical protein
MRGIPHAIFAPRCRFFARYSGVGVQTGDVFHVHGTLSRGAMTFIAPPAHRSAPPHAAAPDEERRLLVRASLPVSPAAVLSAGRLRRTFVRRVVRGAGLRQGGSMYLTEEVHTARPASRRVRVVTLPSSRQLARQLLVTVRAADVLLRQAIRLPDRHQWSVDIERVEAAGGPLAAWDSHVTFRIAKGFAPTVDADTRAGDPDQVAVDIRLFLPEQAYMGEQRVGIFGRRHGNRFGATLSVTAGSRWGGRRNECIPPAGRHVHGDTLEALVDTVAGIVNAALLAAGHSQPGGS